MPFTTNEFFDVFRQYNESVWPVQLLLNAAALTCIALLFRVGAVAARGRIASLLLALLWGWMGIAYHFVFFSRINPAAWCSVRCFWPGA